MISASPSGPGSPIRSQLSWKCSRRRPALPLVAEELGNGKPPDRLPEHLGTRGYHPGQCRRHLRPERDLTLALVREGIELADDFVSTLCRIQLERLERRSVILLESVPRGNGPPRLEDVGAVREIDGRELAKPRQSLTFHGLKIAEKGEW